MHRVNLQLRLAHLRSQGKTVGFVPTMGALHSGHLSLIRKAQKDCDIWLISLFVNPTQFDNAEDLEKYPKVLAEDIALIEKEIGSDGIVFAPKASEMYQKGEKTPAIDFGLLSSSLEGKKRPGHFDGMVQIVRKLLLLAEADVAYFGEKDFQQLSIIRRFVRSENIPTAIVGCPIIRNKDGLALSSRNARLSADGKQYALALFRTLTRLSSSIREKKSGNLKALLLEEEEILHTNENIQLEYLAAVDSQTFEPIENTSESSSIRLLIAAWVEGVRLIDNITL